MENSLTVKSMADALTEDKHKNGSKSKVYKALADKILYRSGIINELDKAECTKIVK